ncbi:hypothetical protein [Carboxylicivirga sp. N1Y90]|uniref:hypothetical protein n=1 Tax=Carboxylicivirga fragile TaxID=3417571 RepID=UPI003D33DB95|nr:hypothetical protein [Marinilabiliaceae bacterium N1Y90]
MNEFNDIQNLWQQQQKSPASSVEEIINKALEQKKKSSRKQMATILVLVTLTAIIAGLWIVTPLGNMVSTGLAIMFSSIFVRVTVEAYSYNRLKNIDIDELSEVYRNKIKSFYKFRKNQVSVVTIVSVVSYIAGFVIMLPTFKATLPHWFYIYIIVFLIVAIPVATYLLVKQASNEIKDIKGIIDEI